MPEAIHQLWDEWDWTYDMPSEWLQIAEPGRFISEEDQDEQPIIIIDEEEEETSEAGQIIII